MLLLRSRFLPLRPYGAMALGPVLLLRRGTRLTHTLLRHESIHWHQCREMLVVPFYVWYVAEWLVRLATEVWHEACSRHSGKPFPSASSAKPRPNAAQRAYRRISFEREAYARQSDPTYLSHRPFWAFLRHLR